MYSAITVLQRISVFCLLALVICTFGASAGGNDNARIVGGSLTSIGQIKYIVQLRSGNHTFCGGTLVAPLFVISAAHCFNKNDYRNTVVVGGVSTLREIGVQRRIAKIVKHPEYAAYSKYSDAVVIKLVQPMTGTNITPVPLCKQSVTAGNMMQISGWGTTAVDQPQSQQLRTTMIPAQSLETCKREFTRFVKKNMLCASGPEAKGTCMGDSGGPAVFGGQLCGITAFSYKCGVPGYMTAFTDVYAIRTFLENTMRSM